MSASSGTNTLYNSSDTSNYISPASGTISTPATLSNNQWGFAVPSSTSDLAPGVGTFSSSYTTPIPDSSTLWAYVPTMNDATYSGKIKQTSTAGTATISPTTAGPGDTVTITTTTYSALDVSSDQISVSIGGYTCQNPVANTSTGTLINYRTLARLASRMIPYNICITVTILLAPTTLTSPLRPVRVLV
jgi:hypothetical protein